MGKKEMSIKYRLLKKEDGYEWYTLLDEVWRATYGLSP